MLRNFVLGDNEVRGIQTGYVVSFVVGYSNAELNKNYIDAKVTRVVLCGRSLGVGTHQKQKR